MTCITYHNGVLMADRLSVIHNNNIPIIVDAQKIFLSNKGDLAMGKSSTIITDEDAQMVMDLARPFIARGDREIPPETFEPVFGKGYKRDCGWAFFIMSKDYIYTTLNTCAENITRHNDGITYPIVDGSGYAFFIIALNNGLSMEEAYAFTHRHDWRVGTELDKIIQAELKPIWEKEPEDVTTTDNQ